MDGQGVGRWMDGWMDGWFGVQGRALDTITPFHSHQQASERAHITRAMMRIS